MQYAFLLPQQIGQPSYPAGSALHQQDLGTKVVVKVYVGANQDILVVMVLQVGQFLTELVQMMVIEQSYCAQGFPIVLPLPSNELLADHIPDELRAVGVLAELAQLLQLLEQGLFYGKTQSGQFCHGPPLLRIQKS